MLQNNSVAKILVGVVFADAGVGGEPTVIMRRRVKGVILVP